MKKVLLSWLIISLLISCNQKGKVYSKLSNSHFSKIHIYKQTFAGNEVEKILDGEDEIWKFISTFKGNESTQSRSDFSIDGRIQFFDQEKMILEIVFDFDCCYKLTDGSIVEKFSYRLGRYLADI
jgi:hypothetical protein